MRWLRIIFAAIIVIFTFVAFIFACNSDKYTPPPIIPSSSGKKVPTTITTAQMVEMLEKGDIKYVGTTHSQMIGITLKNGNSYRCQYIHEQAGKYAKKEYCCDILSLVLYIHDKRFWAKRPRKWLIGCE